MRKPFWGPSSAEPSDSTRPSRSSLCRVVYTCSTLRGRTSPVRDSNSWRSCSPYLGPSLRRAWRMLHDGSMRSSILSILRRTSPDPQGGPTPRTSKGQPGAGPSVGQPREARRLRGWKGGPGTEQRLEAGDDGRPPAGDPLQDLAARLEAVVDDGQLHHALPNLFDVEEALERGSARQALTDAPSKPGRAAHSGVSVYRV